MYMDTKLTVWLTQFHVVSRSGIQDQRVAFSLDKGRTWTNYANNPVLDIGSTEFRDPKVFWHKPSHAWRMAVVLAQEFRVRFYGSIDLLNWEQLSEFGPAGPTGHLLEWECPNFFSVPVEGDSDVADDKWILAVSVQGEKGSRKIKETFGIRYFVGKHRFASILL